MRHRFFEQEESEKPIVQAVEKSVTSQQGRWDGGYEEYTRLTDPVKFMGLRPLSEKEVIEYVKQHHDFDVLSATDTPLDEISMDDIDEILMDNRVGKRENTYNQNWWGPTTLVQIVGPASERSGDPYEEAVVLVSLHHGGDVRGNYGSPKAFLLNSFADEFPVFDASLFVTIMTDKGVITLDAQDQEAYYFNVITDETGVLKGKSDVSYDDLQKVLDFETEGSDIW